MNQLHVSSITYLDFKTATGTIEEKGVKPCSVPLLGSQKRTQQWTLLAAPGEAMDWRSTPDMLPLAALGEAID